MSDRDRLVYRHGFLARPEVKQTPKGRVLTFGLGMPHNYDNGSDTTFVDVDVWNEEVIEFVSGLQKGARIAVEGYAKTREHNGKTYNSISATRVGKVEYFRRNTSAHPAPVVREYEDDELPF